MEPHGRNPFFGMRFYDAEITELWFGLCQLVAWLVRWFG